ncbi:MAG: SDR family oxidoreductase [Corynebacterium sp.]|nr:SDR family oxidoreductase [Corynebacterium sp.]
MMKPDRVLVLGGTGSVGRLVVEALLHHNISARLLSRDPRKAKRMFAELEATNAATNKAANEANEATKAPGNTIEIFGGDLMNPATIADALDHVNAVILTHGAPHDSGEYESVDYGAIPALLEALGKKTIPVVLMSSIGVTNNDAVELLIWKRRGERLLRSSGLPYTIIRPGWFDAGSEDEQRAELRQGDGTEYGSVRRVDVAEALVQATFLSEALYRTVELFSVPGDPLENWEEAFDKATPDAAGALDGIKDTTTLPLDREPHRVVDDLYRFGSMK